MNIFRSELFKILHRRYILALVVVTLILFPGIITVVSYLSLRDNEIPREVFHRTVVLQVLQFSQTFVFLPVWIILVVGHELSLGHINRVVFATSRHYYFTSKILYCFIVSVFFAILGVISFISVMYIARFTPTAGISFYLTSLVQVVVGALSYSILLLAFVIVIRSPVWSFVIYFGWSLVEGILFAAFNSLLEIRLKWLPIHLIRTFYVIDGEPKVVNYYNPFMEAPPSLIAPTILTLGLLIMVKLVIEHRDLPPLSD